MEFSQWKYWLALTKGPHFSAKQIKELLGLLPGISELFSLPLKEHCLLPLNKKQQEYLQSINWNTMEQESEWLLQQGIKLISLLDNDYPELLKQIAKPPIVLFVKGNVSLLNESQFAFVGSRSPTHYGSNVARKFASELAIQDAVVTSGLAIGIDGICHQACLDAGGHTIAVMGAGFRHIYPKRHLNLANRIAEQGLLVSEFYPSTPPINYNFPRRNRIISGLSNGVIVIEAAIKSGSLVTAKYALDQGREVFAVPGNIFSPLSEGTHLLLKQGAKLVTKLDDIIEDFVITKRQHTFVAKKNLADCKLLASVDHDTTPIDVIVQRSNLPVEQVLNELLELEVKGLVAVVPGGYARQA